jgi:hypothetical protein
VREQGGLAPSSGVQPPPCSGWPAAQSFELLHGPSHEVLVDARCQGVQHGAVEGPVVVDPASHLVINSLGEAGQVRAAATVEVPCYVTGRAPLVPTGDSVLLRTAFPQVVPGPILIEPRPRFGPARARSYAGWCPPRDSARAAAAPRTPFGRAEWPPPLAFTTSTSARQRGPLTRLPLRAGRDPAGDDAPIRQDR